MAELKVLLMGPPRITRDQVQVEIKRRKVIALLAHLAVTPGPHNRDVLSETFYAGHDRERAHADFRQSLSLLRNAIGERWLDSAAGAVSLRRQKGLFVDVVAFHKLLDRARAQGGPEGRDDRLRLLTRAVRMYRGHFMAGFSLKDSPTFEQWQAVQEESLRRECSGALEWIIDAHAGSGNLEEAIGWAGTALSLDPLEEGSHRRLMRLLARAGRRTAALRQYEHCREVLEEGLGSEPDEETQALRDEIRSGRIVPVSAHAASCHQNAASPPEPSDTAAGTVLFFAASHAAETTRLKRRVLAGGGSVFSTSDTGIRAVFPSARAALSAAVRIQLPSLAAASRRPRSGRTSGSPRDAPGLRIAVHAGQAESGEAGYAGTAVERTASLLRASHPGQVLVSGPALESAAGRTPARTSFRSLGVRQLDDLGPPVSVYQMVHPSLRSRYPPLKTLEKRPGNLRYQPTSLVGREKELARIVDLIRGEEVRLLTLTGPGGTGKTRLALHAAARLSSSFPHGVYVVDLAAVRAAEDLLPAIASALALREPPGERQPLLDIIISHLRGKAALLLLDTFEHLIPAAHTVGEIAAACPGVRVLATSREPLHLLGEREVRVPPLTLPGEGAGMADLLRSEAVRLFVERARAVRAEFAVTEQNARAVAEICARLDGLPLAIELIAARMKVLAPAELLEKLSPRLTLLTRGADDLPPRQRALRSEISWSHDLLPEAEKRIFRRFAIFAAGCSVDAAVRVCSDEEEARETLDSLGTLADKSLLRREPQADGGTRLCMLQTIREFACEKLEESGERPKTAQRFCSEAVRTAEEADAGLRGPQAALWLDRLDAEQDNLEAALASLHQTRNAAEGIRLAGSLGWYWFRRGRFTAGERRLHGALSISDGCEPPEALARAQYHLGWIRLMLGPTFYGNPSARDCFRDGLASWRRVGDKRGEALCLAWLGWCEADLPTNERYEMADRAVAVARAAGDPWVLSLCLKLAHSFLPREDEAAGEKTAALEESIRLARQCGDPFLVCQAIHGMGDVYRFLREEAAAEPWYLEALEHAEQIGDTWSIFDTRSHLGWGYANRGELARAEAVFADGLRSAAAAGARAYVGQYLAGFAGIAKRRGEGVRALRIGGAASAIRRTGQPGWDPRLAEEARLPPGIAEKEWNAGRSLTVEQAVQYALGAGN